MRRARSDSGWALLVASAALGCACLAMRPSGWSLLAVLVPCGAWLLLHRAVAAALLVACLPLVADVSGGAVGLNVAASDLVMVMITASLALDWARHRSAPELAALGPLKLVVGQYITVILVLLVAHLGVSELVKTGQRLELFLVPMVLGAAFALAGYERWLLRIYVVSATLVAVAWLLGYHTGQKNPSGQFIANAIILLFAAPDPSGLVVLVPLLFAGVLFTQSRGAVLSIGVGLVALLATQRGGRRWRSLLLVAPAAVAGWVAFTLLPDAAQERSLTYSAGTRTAGEWAILIRQLYIDDAWSLIHSNPGTGVGIGQYLAGNAYQGTVATDPHQVLLQQAAEGGYALAVAFVVLVVGVVVVTWVRTRGLGLGPAAIALTTGIAAHGMVDVYWVRGTPVLAWLVVGMAFGAAVREERELRASPRPIRDGRARLTTRSQAAVPI